MTFASRVPRDTVAASISKMPSQRDKGPSRATCPASPSEALYAAPVAAPVKEQRCLSPDPLLSSASTQRCEGAPMSGITKSFHASAAAAGALQILVGLIQAVDPGDTIPTLRPVEHVVLGLYAICLLLLVPAYQALSTFSGGNRSAHIAALGMVLLAVGMTATNLHNEDYGWFAPVAGAANALWLFGTIALAVSLYRAGRAPRWVALGVVLTWIGGIPLSQLGGAMLPGAYWLAIAVLLGAGTWSRSAEQQADRVVV